MSICSTGIRSRCWWTVTELATALERLRKLHGIAAGFTDFRGQYHALGEPELRRLLAALGHAEQDESTLCSEADALEEREWVRVLPPVVVLRRHTSVCFTVLAPLLPLIRWRIETEQGKQLKGQVDPSALPVAAERGVRGLWYVRLQLELPRLPPGYHRLRLSKEDGSVLAATHLVVAPARCHEPELIRRGERVWGPSVQLYTLRSQRNWGIGDFTDLAGFSEAAASLGADMVGLNPLHALFPADPAVCGPYSPSSRHFLNVLYIDPEALPEWRRCEQAQRLVATPEFQSRLERLRAAPLIDYPGVTACKLEVLRLLYDVFVSHGTAARRAACSEFNAQHGRELERFAAFHALQDHFAAAGTNGGWRDWPAPYHDPASAACRAALDGMADTVGFHRWLQWVAQQQLEAAERQARAAGLRLGLYRDLAVGPNAGGAETWGAEDLYAKAAAIGAPPDPLAPLGQDWGIPPFDPLRLREQAYAPFIRLLRANMGRDGILRLDHVMMLFRLWWVPQGSASAAGGYVHYPLDDLMGILALESQRRQCLVIGEDLGTVPDEVRRAMADYGVYSYRVLFFERHSDGRYRRPGEYPREALVAPTTHDLPPLAAFWSGEDIRLRHRLGFFQAPGELKQELEVRDASRRALLNALTQDGLLPESPTPEPDPDGVAAEDLTRAVERYVARSAAAVLSLQAEEWLGMASPVNVPGTHGSYPNWQRKLEADWPEFMASDAVLRRARDVNEARSVARPSAQNDNK